MSEHEIGIEVELPEGTHGVEFVCDIEVSELQRQLPLTSRKRVQPRASFEDRVTIFGTRRILVIHIAEGAPFHTAREIEEAVMRAIS